MRTFHQVGLDLTSKMRVSFLVQGQSNVVLEIVKSLKKTGREYLLQFWRMRSRKKTLHLRH